MNPTSFPSASDAAKLAVSLSESRLRYGSWYEESAELANTVNKDALNAVAITIRNHADALLTTRGLNISSALKLGSTRGIPATVQAIRDMGYVVEVSVDYPSRTTTYRLRLPSALMHALHDDEFVPVEEAADGGDIGIDPFPKEEGEE